MNGIISQNNRETTVRISENVDLLLHLLAHIETGNVASNYDQDYIQLINQEKSPNASFLEKDLEKIAKGSYAYISFLPVYFPDICSIYKILEYVSTQNSQLISEFNEQERCLIEYLNKNFDQADRASLADFISLCKSEYSSFYESYWERKTPDFKMGIDLFYEQWDLEENKVIIDFFKSQQKNRFLVYLSQAMRNNGRGLSFDTDTVSAISRLPESEKDLYYSYFIAIHEMIHQVTDPMVMRVLNIGYEQRSLNQEEDGFNIHIEFEKAVFYVHYKLSSKQGVKLQSLYFNQISKYSVDNIASEENLLKCYPLNLDLRLALNKII